MIASTTTWLLEHYQWRLSLCAAAGIFATMFVAKRLTLLVPAFREAQQLNHDAARKKMQIASYAANQRWNRKWGAVFMATIFGLILPFCLTLEPQPWWRILRDMAVILLVYDFFYYLTHRFLFHESGLFRGPLVWMHALHHQQRNPCRMDSSFIHPLEVACGLGLYVGTTFGLSCLIGPFHVATVVVTWITFSQINQHNHDLWKRGGFPFGYLDYMSKMHHNHHARFTGGNYATISLLYDWMFGTLDHGEGRKAGPKLSA
jgi:sterol desaturase/sphingolipid hydroxylase (fatty acid hydroxylase superfamily)